MTQKIDGIHIPGITDRLLAIHEETFELIARATNIAVQAQQERDTYRAALEELLRTSWDVASKGENFRAYEHARRTAAKLLGQE